MLLWVFSNLYPIVAAFKELLKSYEASKWGGED